MIRHRIGLILATAGLLGGCAEDYNRLRYDTRAPLRVAVLPFTESHSGDTFTSAPLTVVVDALPVVGSDDDRGPATVLRSRFAAKLRQTQLEIVDPTYVDSVLIKNNLYEETAFLTADPKGLGELLGADAVLYGEVIAWDHGRRRRRSTGRSPPRRSRGTPWRIRLIRSRRRASASKRSRKTALRRLPSTCAGGG